MAPHMREDRSYQLVICTKCSQTAAASGTAWTVFTLQTGRRLEPFQQTDRYGSRHLPPDLKIKPVCWKCQRRGGKPKAELDTMLENPIPSIPNIPKIGAA